MLYNVQHKMRNSGILIIDHDNKQYERRSLIKMNLPVDLCGSQNDLCIIILP
jgi:hypothetical protein